MDAHGNSLLKALDSSVKELQGRMDRHSDLVARFLENRVNDENPGSIASMRPPGSRELVLKNAIREAIDILEESRKSFKSKTLEGLRKKLTRVLIDLE